MNPSPTEARSLGLLIAQIAAELSDAGTGDLAELRRLKPEDPGGPAFWRVVVTRLDPELPAGGEARETALRRWAVILRALAALDGLHKPGRRLGAALAEAGVSELRLNKLLRASGEPLFDQVRAVTHQLATAAAPVDLTGLARLVMSDGQPHEQAVRQTIANDYYAVIFHTERNPKEND
jgi:CRISPR type I-E-associated protein CasB/Cse2